VHSRLTIVAQTFSRVNAAGVATGGCSVAKRSGGQARVLFATAILALASAVAPLPAARLCAAEPAPVAADSAAGSAKSPASAPAGGPWNVLWISCEDTSPDLGCYGDRYAQTPHLDRLASEGALFLRAFTHAPVCAPSRSGIITGMYPTTIGTLHMRSEGVPPPYVKCFPEYLRAAGYYCTNAAKTDYNFASPPSAWDECGPRAHWRHRPPGKPFFSVINLLMTHESMIRCSESQFAAATKSVPQALRHDPAKAVLPPYYPDTPVVRRDWTRYYDLVTAMDAEAGRILAELEADGLADRTIVFFWGDHGRGLPRAKRWVYDSGTRVPLLVRWPKHVTPGSIRTDLVAFLDFAPTVLALAGVEIPKHMQGQVILGPRQVPPRRYVYAARDRMDETYDIIRAVRDERYKYIRNFQPEKPYAQIIAYGELMPTLAEWRRLDAAGKLVGPQRLFFRPVKPREELYDTQADPHEVNDLAADPKYAATLQRMREALQSWQKETEDLGLVPEPELRERMRPGGVWQTTSTPKLSPLPTAYTRPQKVTVNCSTDGASIVYTTDVKSRAAQWRLYTGPIAVDRTTTLRVRACRLGFKDSPDVQATYTIQRR
jgi:N-sulfoglucosamine sulfohydrolase